MIEPEWAKKTENSQEGEERSLDRRKRRPAAAVEMVMAEVAAKNNR
jgi:hypothetical protein